MKLIKTYQNDFIKNKIIFYLFNISFNIKVKYTSQTSSDFSIPRKLIQDQERI